MKAIFAIASNGVIGKDNKIPWHIPEDLKFFKEITLNQTVVMGRKTYESIISYLGKPLPKRKTIVISKTLTDVPEGVEIHRNTDNLPDDCIVCGGLWLYINLIPRCSEMYVTFVDKPYEGDTYFHWEDYSKHFNKYEIIKQTDEFEIGKFSV